MKNDLCRKLRLKFYSNRGGGRVGGCGGLGGGKQT